MYASVFPIRKNIPTANTLKIARIQIIFTAMVLALYKKLKPCNDVNSQMCLLQFWDWSKIKEKIQDKILELSEISRDQSLEDYFEPIFAENAK